MFKNLAYLKLLSRRNFRSFLILQVFTLLAMQFYFLSLAWLTLDMTDSTMILGVLLTITAIPRLVLVPIGGALFDRVHPKTLLITNISVLVMSTMLFTILLLFLPVATWMLVVFSILFGVASAIFLPTSFALIPKMVPAHELQPANSLSQLSMQLSNTFGPAIAGILIASFGIPAVYITMTLFFSISLLFSLLLKNIRVSDREKEDVHNKKFSLPSLAKDVFEGLRIINKNKLILMLVVISALLNLSIIGPQQIGLPYIASQNPSGGANSLGFLMSSLGFGTLTGVILTGFIKQFKSKGKVTMIATVALGILWSFVGFAPAYIYMTAVILFLSGVCIGIINVLVVTLIQIHTPIEALGRVMSLQLLGSTGIQPITFLVVGWLLGMISPALLFLLSGLILVLTASISLCFKRIRQSDNVRQGEALG